MQDNIQVTYDHWLSGVGEADRPAFEKLSDTPDELSDAARRRRAFPPGCSPTRPKATRPLSSSGTTCAMAAPSSRSVRLRYSLPTVSTPISTRAYLYPRLEPTPALSFAVCDLGCDAGIVITASHNPKEYNGYKVYGPDGCQITTEMTGEIQAAIDAV